MYFNHYDALLADVYQTYQLDIRGLEDGSLDPFFVASLVAQLPRGSRVWEALHIDAWTLDTWLLNAIENDIRCLIYSFTEDAKTGANKPKPMLPLFGDLRQNKDTDNHLTNLKAIPMTDLDKVIAAQFEGVNIG